MAVQTQYSTVRGGSLDNVRHHSREALGRGLFIKHVRYDGIVGWNCGIRDPRITHV